LKILENKENTRDDDIIVSNDNNEYFGEIIDRKCLLWAINQEVICDYVIQTIMTNEEQLERELLQFNVVEENDKRLFLSAFTSLKSIHDGHSHHLLIYANNKDNSSKLVQYVTSLLKNNYFDIPELFSSNYHSEMNPREQSNILTDFKNAKFGIISCVYCLGEGWDFPLLDAVVFAENMSSIIRIVQSALRASRKNKFQPNKITKIILPILNSDDWLENNENSDLKKVKEVIHQIGLEDETVAQKIKVFKITIEKHPPKPKMPKHESIMEFGEYDDEFTQKIRLKTVKRIVYGISYEKAKKIIASKKIKSKESYFELCENDNRLSKEPEILYKGQFVNWIDYLSIERIYYDLETCKNKVSEYLSNETNIDFEFTNITKSLKKLDDIFPPYDLWCEYYDINDLTEIIKQNKNEELVEF
jgi:predicted helicase